MIYTTRYLEEVAKRMGADMCDESQLDAICAEAEQIESIPSEHYPIMARVRPEAALDGIRLAGFGDCETVDVTAHDLLVAMDKGAEPEVSQENLRALLLIAQRWGEDEVQRRGDVAEAEAMVGPCATCRDVLQDVRGYINEEWEGMEGWEALERRLVAEVEHAELLPDVAEANANNDQFRRTRGRTDLADTLINKP